MNKKIILLIVAIALGFGLYYYKDSLFPAKNIDPATVSEKYNTAIENARTAFVNKDYKGSVKFYKEAIKYRKEDHTAYAGLYVTYGAEEKWDLAMSSLDKAIELYPTSSDYWKWKMQLMDEKTDATYEELLAVLEKAFLEVEPKTKVNLVTYFAGVAEKEQKIDEAIAYWEQAKTLNPERKDIFQQEINRLKK